MTTAQEVLLDPEFWKMVTFGLPLAFSPLIHHWLLSKYDERVVNLFGCSLPIIALGTYYSGLGLAHFLYTPLLMLASWKVCVMVIATVDMMLYAVDYCVTAVCNAFCRLIMSMVNAFLACRLLVMACKALTVMVIVATAVACPDFAFLLCFGLAIWALCEGIAALERWVLRLIARACDVRDAALDATEQAAIRAFHGVVAAASAHRMWTAALLVAAICAFPPLGVPTIIGLAYWMICQVVLAVEYLVQCVVDLACSACAAAMDAANHAIATTISALLAVRAWTVAAVVVASFVFPPFGELVVLGLAGWVIYQVLRALVDLVQRAVALACAACEAANDAANRAIGAITAAVSAAVQKLLSVARSIRDELFSAAMSVLLVVTTLLLRVLAYSLQTASMANFLVNPSVESFVGALVIKVAVALAMKYAAAES